MPLTEDYAIELASGLKIWDEDTSENVEAGIPRARRTIVCHWAERWDIINLLGTGDDGFGMEYPDNPILRARNIDIANAGGTPLMGVNGMVGFELARLNVEYLLPEDNIIVEGDEIGGETIDFSTEPLVYDTEKVTWKWDGGDDIQPATIPNRTERVVQFSKWARGFSTLPIALILSLIDRVNTETIFGADPETVLFLGGQSTRRILTTGVGKWDIQWKHKWKASGFNNQFDPDTGTFRRVVAKNNPTRSLFLTGDLNDLYP